MDEMRIIEIKGEYTHGDEEVQDCSLQIFLFFYFKQMNDLCRFALH